MPRFENLDAVRAANIAAGHFWFAPDSMAFFNSKIESRLFHGHYFITSETPDDETPRRYAVRFALSNGHIATLGEMREHESVEKAIEAIQDHYLSQARQDGDVPDDLFA